MDCSRVLLLILCVMLTAGRAVASGIWTMSTLDTRASFEMRGGAPFLTKISMASGGKSFIAPDREVILPDAIFLADGTRLDTKWHFDGASASENKVTFKYSCKELTLDAVSTWSATRLPGPVEHSLVITSSAGHTVYFCPTPTISFTAVVPDDHKLHCWWVEKGAGSPPSHGTNREIVDANFDRRLLSGPYSDDQQNRDVIPWFSLQDITGECGIYGGIEFSGWVQIAVRGRAENQVSVSMGSNPNEWQTRLSIGPNSSCELPTCFVGVYTGGVEDGSNRLHRWVEKHLRPPMPCGLTPLLVNNSFGGGTDIDAPLSRQMIDECADMGMELFHIDAGWYKEVGDWYENPARFPKGLQSIADYAHSKGVLFGLWVAWAQGGSIENHRSDTLSVFSPAQKDWFGVDYGEDWCSGGFTGAPVCLASPARDWALGQLRRVLKDYKLDMLEHDQVMITDNCTRTNHGHTPEDPVDTSRAACERYYSIYDTLLKENPKLILEDCVNGGRLVDFGVARRMHYFSATDHYDPVANRAAFYDASYPLPPSMIECYVGDHGPRTIANLKYMIRSGMMGWCSIMLNTHQWNEKQKAAAKHEFDLYKNRLRPLIANGNIYHVMPRPRDDGWDGIQYFDPQTGNGVLFAFRSGSADPSEFAVKLRGLDPQKAYVLAPEDGSVKAGSYSGKQLMTQGLVLSIPEREGSDLIFIQQARTKS